MSLVTLAGLGILAVVVAGIVAIIWRWPLGGITTFLLVIAFVPIWVIVPTPFITPSAASGVAGLVAIALALRSSTLLRWTFPDLLTVFLLVTATGPVLFGLVPVSSVLDVVTIWCTAYIVGRVVLLNVEADLLYAIIGVIFGLVGFLAMVEFFTGWHGLSSWGPYNGARVTWGSIQERAGLSRAEGAFGHAIALGSTLAMTSVLTLQARLPRFVRVVLIAFMVGGTGVTLSRGPLVCLGLGLVLALLFLHEKRVREVKPAVAVLSAAGLILVAPLILGVFSEAGAEARSSAEYRANLVSLLKVVETIGRSSAVQITPLDKTYIGGFSSIDNQMLIFGLNYGWLFIGLVVLLMLTAVFALVTGRGSTPCVAIVAQLPALVTVALITQYAVFFWFVLGLAIGAEQLRSQARAPGTHMAPEGDLQVATSNI
jgi:hypothetical protein